MVDEPATKIPEFEAGGRLTIGLAALQANWRTLAERSGSAETAAVVKADAYGIGIEAAVPALAAAGCRTFFVALLCEARRVRAAARDATIYVLGGLVPRTAPVMNEIGARPVLNSLAEVDDWARYCRAAHASLPAAIHVDTGMNRLGLSAPDVEALVSHPDPLSAFDVTLVMSHLACADTPTHPLNARQVTRFEELRTLLPVAPASLSNSAATMVGEPYRFDMTRPGIALYGGRALSGMPNPMKPVVRAEARIMQIRDARAGDPVGYGGIQTLKRQSRIAIISAGYADGYTRAAGSSDKRPGASVFIGDHEAPLIGRVSMDMLAADVTDIPKERIRTGDYAELLGNRITIDDLADHAGTIGYEILTGLGRRFTRVYVGGE